MHIMAGPDGPRELGTLRPNTVFRCPETGEVGYVERRVPSAGEVIVHMESQGTVRAKPDMRVEIVVEPDVLALAFVCDANVRARVDAAIKAERARIFRSLDAALGARKPT